MNQLMESTKLLEMWYIFWSYARISYQKKDHFTEFLSLKTRKMILILISGKNYKRSDCCLIKSSNTEETGLKNKKKSRYLLEEAGIRRWLYRGSINSGELTGDCILIIIRLNLDFNTHETFFCLFFY